MGCLGFHLWPYRADDADFADELRIDLDPQPGVSFDQVREAAGEVRAVFGELQMPAFVKTSGRRGLHVYVRLAARIGTPMRCEPERWLWPGNWPGAGPT